MFQCNSDQEWERFGRDNAYYGVLSHDEYRGSNLDADAKRKFFDTGKAHVDNVMRTVREQLDPDFTAERVLDFGCGVGRTLIPLAGIASHVTGIDISDAMLAEARSNCEELSVRNAALVKGDDSLSGIDTSYNLIHSFIVFQHIPPARGERIFARIIQHLEPGGVCAVHFHYASRKPWKRAASFAHRYIPLFTNFLNVLRKRNFFAPRMQMNEYDVNYLLKVVQEFSTGGIHLEFTDHGGELGVMLFFQRY